MKRWLVAIVLGPIAFLANSQALPASGAENACIECHTFMGGELAKPVSQWEGSIHQNQGISCETCHGGNADLRLGHLQRLGTSQFRALSKQAMYAASDFVGAPSGQAQFDLCANCHPDAVKIFSASLMGRAYLHAQGGPSCTRCHGAHRNVIPAGLGVCKGCHRDTTGLDQMEPEAMNITDAQVEQLARIRVRLGEEKVGGRRPLFKRHLESVITGLIVWGLVVLLFVVAIGLHRLVKGGHEP